MRDGGLTAMIQTFQSIHRRFMVTLHRDHLAAECTRSRHEIVVGER